MKAVIQQVAKASVYIRGEKHSSINRGMLIFLGIKRNDKIEDVNYLVRKIIKLRIFKDKNHKMNLSLLDLNLSILLVSQFTLYADMKKGHRPSFINTEKPQQAEGLYNLFIVELNKYNINLQTGEFGENMQVELLNDGPNTFILES